MKKLIILFALLLAVPCYGQELALMNPYIMGAGVVASPSGDWYYSAGSDTYDTTESMGAGGAAIGALISVTAGSSVTKIGVKFPTAGTRALKLALYDDCDLADTHNCTVLASCTEITSFVNGWNDCTLTSPYAITPTVTLTVVGDCDTASGSAHTLAKNSTTGTWVYEAQAYATFPDTLGVVDHGSSASNGFRLWSE